MSRELLVFSALAILLGGGAVVVTAPEALAFHNSGLNLEERRAQREAEREARRMEREAARAEREAEREARRAEREAEKEAEENAPCGCSARLKFAKPDLQYRGGTLAFIPRVDVDVRTRGEASGPDWSVSVDYEGESVYESEDIEVPSGVSFSGQQEIVSGACGDNSYSFSGVALPEVSLSGLVRTLLGIDQELEGRVRMKASILGCGFEEEHRIFGFDMEELGNLKIRSWRAVR